MVRQAHTYLAGAVSGTALVAAAVVAFVLLVSLQALREWPLAGIGLGDEGSPAQQAAPGAAEAAGGVGTRAAGRTAARGAALGAGGLHGKARAPHGRPGVESAPGRSPGGTPTAPGSGTTGSSGSSAAGGSPSGGGGATGGGGSPSSGGGGGQTQGPTSNSPSSTVTGTVNGAVSGADEATGGALGEAGVTEATGETVNGVAGPESTVGKTVDGTVEAVGGALNPGH